MAASQAEKGKAFRALHGRPGAFVIPNHWDAGTARTDLPVAADLENGYGDSSEDGGR